MFDPDPTRGARMDLDGIAAMGQTFQLLMDHLLNACSDLPRYFQTISDQRLRAHELSHEEWEILGQATQETPGYSANPIDLAEIYFKHVAAEGIRQGAMTWRQWEDWILGHLVSEDIGRDIFGFAADRFEVNPEPFNSSDRGELVPEALYEGLWFTSAQSGIASAWPRVTLGVLTLVATARITLSENRRETESNQPELARENHWRFSSGRMAEWEVLAPWLLHLAVAPMGGSTREKLTLVLIAERLVDDTSEAEIRNWYSQHLPENPIAHLDYPDWSSDPMHRRLAATDTALWSINSEVTRNWLAIKCVPSHASQARSAEHRDVRFSPFFSAPAGFSPISARSPAGLIERNLLFAPANETLLHRLVEDAQMRIDALNQYQRTARAEFGAAWTRYEGGEPEKSQ